MHLGESSHSTRGRCKLEGATTRRPFVPGFKLEPFTSIKSDATHGGLRGPDECKVTQSKCQINNLVHRCDMCTRRSGANSGGNNSAQSLQWPNEAND